MVDPSQMSMNEWMASGVADAAVADAFQEFLMLLGFTGDIPVRATNAAVRDRALNFISERDKRREQELCCTVLTMMDRWALPTDALWDQFRAGAIELRPLLLNITSQVYTMVGRLRETETKLAVEAPQLRRDIAILREEQLSMKAALMADPTPKTPTPLAAAALWIMSQKAQKAEARVAELEAELAALKGQAS